MIKNKTIQLIFQTIYVILGFLGAVNSLGYFDAKFNNEFYVYYTNLSNYICLGVMVAIWIRTINESLRKQDCLCTTLPTFNFLCLIMILVTFLVYNLLLAKDKTVVEYFTSLGNMTMHVILPIMFVLNWILFYEHGKLKWYYPFLCFIMPLIYVAFIVIRASLLKGNTSATLYPYFFLNIDKLGFGGFLGWVGALLGVFLIIGYVFCLFDNFKKVKKFIKKG